MINLFFGIGNLTRDPDLRYTPQGVPVCKFSIAINRKYNDRDETTFLNVVTWSGLAENCAKYLNKGSKVAVVGEIRVNEWETKDGDKRKDYDINANQVQFLSTKKIEKAKEKLTERERKVFESYVDLGMKHDDEFDFSGE